ncbi:hypothetical protein ACFO25_04120 [Paenactinomyces guangxiensis]|uniref:Uncharacterized protein n=1 Tax=Paenactinomyces guangxiensis TaxID=1490290 RepID=A0A7W1WNV3_9BACL|nr:hypothetical protein [Paenactinomyces guangxiensis]MBA4493343.1 hypothetical protein [Paenactinomyces guangxiensis]MBH8593431.1 hypothetical protein [Paenactinomyces guangxiensis]
MVKIDDLALVYANCHCMIHRMKEPLTIDKLQEVVLRNQSISNKKAIAS